MTARDTTVARAAVLPGVAPPSRDRIEGRLGGPNNFDFLRFAAASVVIVFHAYPQLGAGADPISRTGVISLGGMAVRVFFAISGFLVTQSWDRDPRLVAFAWKRALRILPALFSAVLFTAFVVGALTTKLPLGEYFASPETWKYVAKNSAVYPITHRLPGVFEDLPFSWSANGSLWTLPYETTMYLMVAALGLAGLVTRRRGFLVFALAVLAVCALTPIVPALSTFKLPPSFHLFWEIVWQLTPYFLVGGLLYLFRDRVPVRLDVALAMTAWALACAAFDPTTADAFLAPTVSYLVIVLAFTRMGPLARFGRHGDFSYGMYVYAFPIAQALVQWTGGDLSPATLSFCTFALTLPVAAASWHLVEKRALRWKRVLAPSVHDRPSVAPRA